MQNQDFFANYGTEKWAVEENLCFLLQEYWEAIRTRTGVGKELPISLPLNPVTFVKGFMKEETLVEVKYVEQSKMTSLEKNEITAPPTDFIEGDFREVSTLQETYTGLGKLVWPGEG